MGRDRTARQWILVLVGLALAFGLPEIHFSSVIPGANTAGSLASELKWWSFALVMVLYIVLIERLPLSSIGLHRPTWKTLVFGLLGAVVLFASAMLVVNVIFPALGYSMNQSAVAGITSLPVWIQVAIVARAAVCEEILYRGYPIERIEYLTGSKVLAAIVSIGVFTAVHLAYWGWPHVLIVFAGAIIFALMYQWRRDLLSNMLAHFLVDLVGFLAAQVHAG